jgi:hypothetical protein
MEKEKGALEISFGNSPIEDLQTPTWKITEIKAKKLSKKMEVYDRDFDL